MKKLSMRKMDCPVTERITRDTAFFEQNILLAGSENMVDIADAVKKIRSHASELHRIEVTKDKFMGSAVLKKAAKKQADKKPDMAV